MRCVADAADIVTDRRIEPADRTTIQIGMDLHGKYPDGTLTVEQR